MGGRRRALGRYPVCVSGRLPDSDEILASDRERDHVAAWLGIALDDGRLSLAEYERRTEAVYAAATRGDLQPLTADLPSPTRSEFEQRMSSADTRGYAGVAYPPSRVAPYVTGLVVVFIAGAFYGRFVGTIWPLVCFIFTVLAAGGLGWAYWDPYGHKGRRD